VPGGGKVPDGVCFGGPSGEFGEDGGEDTGCCALGKVLREGGTGKREERGKREAKRRCQQAREGDTNEGIGREEGANKGREG
jgi:hypothetical protein